MSAAAPAITTARTTKPLWIMSGQFISYVPGAQLIAIQSEIKMRMENKKQNSLTCRRWSNSLRPSYLSRSLKRKTSPDHPPRNNALTIFHQKTH
eukprot:scaffold79856_cov24-Cyclotella_meneghiniana.AAC.2